MTKSEQVVAAKKKVVTAYLDATAEKVIYDAEVWQIRSMDAGLILGEGDTEEDAWIDAAKWTRAPAMESRLAEVEYPGVAARFKADFGVDHPRQMLKSEVESGGLPPRPTREHMKQFARALQSFSFIQHAEFNRWANEVEGLYEASLLREKELTELLKFVEDVIGGWDTLHSFGCTVEDEEIAKLVAVTGE